MKILEQLNQSYPSMVWEKNTTGYRTTACEVAIYLKPKSDGWKAEFLGFTGVCFVAGPKERYAEVISDLSVMLVKEATELRECARKADNMAVMCARNFNALDGLTPYEWTPDDDDCYCTHRYTYSSESIEYVCYLEDEFSILDGNPKYTLYGGFRGSLNETFVSGNNLPSMMAEIQSLLIKQNEEEIIKLKEQIECLTTSATE